MSNKDKAIDTKNRTYYFFNDIINIKELIKMILKQMKSHTKLFLFFITDISRSKIRNT